MITFIWAEDEQQQIGLLGHLPWTLPGDMQHFKELTVKKPMVMGRKTFTSFPNVLPKRKHVVLTTDEKLTQKYQDNTQVIIFNTLVKLKYWLMQNSNQEIGVIGGAVIFKELLDKVDCLEKTVIHHTFVADTRMPAIDYNQFELVKQIHHEADRDNAYAYDFLTYLRKEVYQCVN